MLQVFHVSQSVSCDTLSVSCDTLSVSCDVLSVSCSCPGEWSSPHVSGVGGRREGDEGPCTSTVVRGRKRSTSSVVLLSAVLLSYHLFCSPLCYYVLHSAFLIYTRRFCSALSPLLVSTLSWIHFVLYGSPFCLVRFSTLSCSVLNKPLYCSQLFKLFCSPLSAVLFSTHRNSLSHSQLFCSPLLAALFFTLICSVLRF